MTTAPLESAPPTSELAPYIRRLKERLLTAKYEICMARARHFTEVYRQSEGLDPALRNARALQRTLSRQAIFIYDDEQLVGSKTERYLSTPLSVERGDFLRVLQLELDVLEQKRRPFRISDEERRLFWDEILPYWDGRTLHDDKARRWEADGLIHTRPTPQERLRGWYDGLRFLRYTGRERLRRMLGAAADAPLSRRRLRDLFALRCELARTQPTPALYCMDVQGHLVLGVDRAVELGMEELIRRAAERRTRLQSEAPDDVRGAAFLEAVIESLESAIAYSERFARLAEIRAAATTDADERRRLERIAAHCHQVPRHPARSFHEALQSAWMTQVVGEIQFGTMDVFGVGRVDQFLYPFYRRDVDTGALTRDEATSLIQEYFLKLSSNVSPIPELGMEANAVLGNSQHCVTIGGVASDGSDATNELSELFLAAYEQLGGAVNQLCVRLHRGTPRAFTRRASAVFRTNNGIAFYNDEAIVEGLLADGMTIEDARDYCVVGCVETCGQSNTQACVAGHDLVLPAVLLLALTNGAVPPPSLGQRGGYRSGDPETFATFDDLLGALERQLAHQLDLLVRAIGHKDQAHIEMHPAPYVSALTEGCIERATDITGGGARYDFTSVDVRGVATLIDSLLAIELFVYQRRELSLDELMDAVLRDFAGPGQEVLRQRILHQPPKYGSGHPRAQELTARVVAKVHEHIAGRRNVRGGRYRAAWFSVGNHVIDGILLGATPDGRKAGVPISNGVSASNLVPSTAKVGPQTVLRSVARLPASQVSSGVALNLRFHPSFIEHERGLETFAAMLETYFAEGGMQLQPNVVSVETLRDAQLHPERHRDLVVKVSGYSAAFTDLGRSIQDDIIVRADMGDRA